MTWTIAVAAIAAIAMVGLQVVATLAPHAMPF